MMNSVISNPLFSFASRKKIKGFTLIEILVVMLIISIIGAAALLTISTNQNKQYESFTNHLTNLLKLAEEEAMLRPAVLGLAFTTTQYQFFIYRQKITADESHWQPLSDHNFAKHALPDNVKITVIMQDKVVPLDGKPQIIFSQNGDAPSFKIIINNKNGVAVYQIIGATNGTIKNEKIHAQ